MTNSLRKEIKKIMKRRGDDWRRNHMRDFDINDRYTDEVISKIEKRIDELEQLRKEKKSAKDLMDYIGYQESLRDFKEILK